MKQLLLLFLLIPSLCFGAVTLNGKTIATVDGKTIATFNGVTVGGAPSCNLYHSSSITTGSYDGASVFYGYVGYPGNTWHGQYVTDDTSPSICKIIWNVHQINGDVSSVSYQAEIYALGSSFQLTPGSPLGVSNTVTGITTGDITFTFATPVQLTGGSSNRYAFVLTRTDHATDQTNNIWMGSSLSDGDSGYSAVMWWGSSGAYIDFNVAADCAYQLFKQ